MLPGIEKNYSTLVIGKMPKTDNNTRQQTSKGNPESYSSKQPRGPHNYVDPAVIHSQLAYRLVQPTRPTRAIQTQIKIDPYHLFRYASEWDPRKPINTKGGYIRGQIHLPPHDTDIRLSISTHPEKFHPAKEAFDVRSNLIHVVRKGTYNKRELQTTT